MSASIGDPASTDLIESPCRVSKPIAASTKAAKHGGDLALARDTRSGGW